MDANMHNFVLWIRQDEVTPKVKTNIGQK